MAAETLRHPSIQPTHPGTMLAEIVIPATGKTKTEIARLLGISRQTLYTLCEAKQALTPEVAVRLDKLFGNGPALWLSMQADYDLRHAERTVDTSAIPTLHAA